MIRGLFPRAEQDAVLALVERSIVLVIPGNIQSLLLETDWLSSAWKIAYHRDQGTDLQEAHLPGVQDRAGYRYMGGSSGLTEIHVCDHCKTAVSKCPQCASK